MSILRGEGVALENSFSKYRETFGFKVSANYQVRWAKGAQSDLAEIIEYIMQNSPANAHDVFNKIKIKIEDLALLPDRGRIVPELFSQGISLYREII